MKAWRCHGRNQKEMVDRLWEAGIVRSPRAYNALVQVDRAQYAPIRAYQDAPQVLKHGQTISAPHMHAHALEAILPTLEKQRLKQTGLLRILDVGCGSGYLTACFGRLFLPQREDQQCDSMGEGIVTGIDIHSDLVETARTNMVKMDSDLLNDGVVTLKTGNGWKASESSPHFDAIHVGAAASHFPRHLANQLKLGGIMIIPIGPKDVQQLYQVERLRNSQDEFIEEDFSMTKLLNVRYVPLVESLGS